MKHLLLIPAACILPSISAVAQDQPTKAVAAKTEDSELTKLTKTNSLKTEKLKAELADMRANVTKLKLQRELLSEKMLIEDIKQKAKEKAELKKATDLKTKFERNAAIAKSKASLASYELALEKTNILRQTAIQEAELLRNTAMQEAQLKAIRVNKQRESFADAKPVYLENPLQNGDTLVISDRRITFNGAVTSKTADHICDRIHYYNNKDKKLPIFIVIDYSPGGSVMAGYRILKAMEGSSAPIHVVVKSFAASMAASITTLAEESYAYPNAIILHHQISSSHLFYSKNLTQQKEAYESSKKWWDKLASPIAKKMGISTDEFIKQMYEKNSDGDWVEFGTEAQKLKWVDHIVSSIKETGANINPDNSSAKNSTKNAYSSETIGKDGKPCVYLPRLNPHDAYFIYNPDGYFRTRQ